MASDTPSPEPEGSTSDGESGDPPVAPTEADLRWSLEDRPRMVRWYAPMQLARTAIDVMVSTLMGQHADARLREAMAGTKAETFNYAVYEDGTPVPELWLDYVGDMGDGWDSTYAVAWHLAQPHLEVTDPKGGKHRLDRGRLLILGGDQVYPVASRKNYLQRLVHPYRSALPYTQAPHPHVFAIPGNHDWYDSLVSFTRLFCSREWFGGWRTRQRRSYFALRLPHGWWLLGTDVQLGSDIDRPQVEYFRRAAALMKDTDRVILCNAEPHWVYTGMYQAYDSEYNENNLRFLEEKVLGKKVAVFIAGDQHHYRRFASPDGTQKITAGGGGAFLHNTHGNQLDSLPGGFDVKACYPSEETSSRLMWRNLLFPFYNLEFGIVPGLLYSLTGWAVKADVGTMPLRDFWKALGVGLHATLLSPTALFLLLAIIGGVVMFTDSHSSRFRWIAGIVHALAHVTAAFLIGWATLYFSVSILGLEFLGTPQMLLAMVLNFVGGAVVGSFLLGLYLLISINLFGRHGNEASSALRIQDYKSFLRLRIDPQGHLTLYPIKLEKVARRWRRRTNEAIPSLWLPDDPKATPPTLIEPPVRVRPPPSEPVEKRGEG